MEANARALHFLLQIVPACLWGSLLIAGVGIFCRALPRLPASFRAWLWWLACAKLLLGLCITAPISLAVLPAPPPAARMAAGAVPPVSQAHLPLTHGAFAGTPVPAVSPAPFASVSQAPRWPLLLLALWALGIAASARIAMRQSWTLTQLQRGASPALLPHGDLEALARQMGLRRVPGVLTGPNIPTPCVAGWLRPVILLPLRFAETASPGERRLTLAHELAHVKRGDLPMAIIPALARAVFFFHPLAWWAAAEWAAAREEACDAWALDATNLPAADYGRLLLKLAAPTAAPPALGLSPGYHALRRRLRSLASARRTPRRARLFALALPLLLPWRLSAAPSPDVFHSDTAPPTRYTVTTLADEGEVFALNNAGQVALSVRQDGEAQGYAGSIGALAATEALPKHHASLAYGINDLGQAAGASFNIPGHARAFFWDGATHKIGSLPGFPYSEARAVNASGEVAGFAETGRADRRRAWITRAFLRRPDAPLTDLGTLGGPYSAAYAVNQSGTVAGKADMENFGVTHAFTWTDGQMTDLGTLGGANSVAYTINDAGQVAGASDIDNAGTRHAFLYADGQMQDLVPLPAMTSSTAYAVSSSGQVVGASQTSTLKYAALWQNGRPINLNTLLPFHSGWTLTEARAVNDHGQIAGIGLFHGHQAAFLLTPR